MSLARLNRNRTMAEDRLAGMTYAELGKKYGLAKSAVYYALSNEEIKNIIETGTRHAVSLVPKAISKIERLIDSEDEKVALQASKEICNISSIAPSHSQNVFIQNIHNSQDIHITAELSDMQAYLSSRWAKAKGGSCTMNRTEEINSCNDSDYVDAEIVDTPKKTPKSESNENDTRG